MAQRDGSDLNGSWIKLYRKLQDWRWYKNSAMVHLWLHILISVNTSDKEWEYITIPRGSFITSVNSLSQETGLSVRQIRTCLERLKSTNELTIKTTNRYTMITVNNFDSYQENPFQCDKQNDKQIDKRATNERQTDDKRATTTKEYKESKKEKNVKNRESVCENAPTPAQLARQYFENSTNEDYRNWILWTEKKAPWVYANMTPLDEGQFDYLRARFGSDLMASNLMKLQNRKDLRGRYESQFTTLKDWCETDMKRQAK